ncbi:MAG: DUF1194 domain-containing protein, partial [Alphaproteobacteria bacterium]|nr:DUF1194 domain-containing protein [Alphaproteobacteria bacterium]
MTTTPPRVSRRNIVRGLALGALAAPFPVGAQNPAPKQVDVALVLAVDCSRSIDEGEYRLQAQGYADAFRTDRVQRAALSGRHGAIAVIMTQWGGQFVQKEATPWTLLDGKPAFGRFADTLSGMARLVDDDATSIGAAIDHGRRMLERIPFL